MYSELLDTREIDGFTVKIFAQEEDMHPDMTYEFQDDKHRQETLEWMERQGLSGWFCAAIKVYKAGVELGSDYLGCCSYESFDAFLKDDYCVDMIKKALDEAKKELPLLIKRLEG